MLQGRLAAQRALRLHLAELEASLRAAKDQGGLTDEDVRAIVERSSAGLEPVERALRASRFERLAVALAQWLLRQRAAFMWWLQRRRRAIRAWLSPRIGQLEHYPPRPIRLPTSYRRATPPTPAPAISIVTPSYQQACYLERTLRSVLSQDYPSLEYVVQDGASSDGSVEILHRYERMLAGWASEPDHGQAEAINRGFARTSGEIMGWLNSDDLLLPGSLSTVSRYFAEHPDVDVVYGDRVLVDENDHEIGVWILPRHDDAILRVADYVPQETLFWRRRVWDAVGGRLDTTFSYALDWDLLLRFQESGARMVHLKRFLGAFPRLRRAQKTTASSCPSGSPR